MNSYLSNSKSRFSILAAGFFISSLQAATLSSTLYSTEGKLLGKIEFEDRSYGLLIKPNLSGLPTGIHGFHIHEFPNCGNQAQSAGGHFDPKKTNSHQGPYGNGHLGDLPVLVVDSQGIATIPTLAPRLKTNDIKNRSIMVHAGGDNYSNNPALGGGGARIACGTIPS